MSSALATVTVDMFECDQEDSIPYTLVCDFRQDCYDGSDEKHCQHPTANFTGFRCRSWQIVDRDRVCDFTKECLDGSDEDDCDNYRHMLVDIKPRKLPPVIIHMDGHGGFSDEAMTSSSAPCPSTHFRCPGVHVYCMPVFLRCNGVKDCGGGEDEVGCADATCPGLYRCRASSVCVHTSHLCDGWPQCPQRDDELACHVTCPWQCRCQGLAFVCRRPFPAPLFPRLTYLQAEGSAMGPAMLTHNVYLVFLSLASCRLDAWPPAAMHNLQRLDLSNNTIQTLSLHNVALMRNLRVLRLNGNPLTSLVASALISNHQSLTTVDLSHTLFVAFNSTLLVNFVSIEKLNLSFSSVSTISDDGFSGLPNLRELDLTGSEIDEYPVDLFSGSKHLSQIYTSNYKLCCQGMLPDGFDKNSCFAPQDEVSSCEDLLRSNVYRAFLWLISMLSMIGNAGCLVSRTIVQRGSLTKSGYNVFVTHLSLADCLMGVYLALVGAADGVYRGSYLWNERRWRGSAVCQVAGFLSLVSSEVSALMICLITLDRFLVLRFPFSTVRFRGRSAVLACGLAWACGLLLAAPPLLPPLQHWRFYSQTGICIPLPVTRNNFQGRGYAFGVMIVFNCVLFVLIALGQSVVYWSIRVNTLDSERSGRGSQDLTVARRLVTVVLSDFLCWFPIGVLGLLAFNGVAVPGEVNVAMAIFVLPLNSALNPFLYTFNMLLERRRKAREARLMALLKARAVTHSSKITTSDVTQ